MVGSDPLFPPRWLAAVPLGFYLAHAVGYHVVLGNSWDALWLCYLANLVLALGLLVRSSRLIGVAALWLVLGNALWLLHLATGGRFVPGETLPHWGGLAVAVLALARSGMPSGTWLRSFGVLTVGVLASRLITPEPANVNLSHAVWRGWEALFPSYPAYMALLALVVGALFWAVERVARALLTPPQAHGGQK